MGLHIPTLLLVNALVMGLSGSLLLYSWWRGRDERTLLWMGSLLLLAVPGIIMNTLRGMGFDYVPIILGNIILLLATAMHWTAMRVFAGRSLWWPGLLAGPVLWALLSLWPAFYQSVELRVPVYSLLVIGYMLASASELWRSRWQLDVSIAPALVLMACHGGFYSVRLFLDPGAPLGASSSSAFFAVVVIESMLYAVGAGFITLSMVKERAEAHYREASLTDALTGIGNRRAFTQAAQKLLERSAGEPRRLALLLCDLDNFKQVNDRLGHPAGDWVLRRFAEVLVQHMGPGAVFGRIGGEEFACLVEAEHGEALALAERIRKDFSTSVREQGPLSTSIGIATAAIGGLDLSRLLSLADAALYQAKHEGRDRVVLSELQAQLSDVGETERRRRFR